MIPSLMARPLRLVLLGLLLTAGCQGREGRALATVKKLGGKYKVDEQKADKPIVMIDLGFTAADNKALVPLKDLTSLQSLYLWNTGVTDAGLEHLQELTGLQKLDLSGTAVSDAGLVRLKGLTGLQELNLKGSKVTKAGAEDLRKALPKTKIIL